MASIRTTPKIALVAAAISPAAAFAGSFWHATGGEPGAAIVPEHWQGRSAADAHAELDAARADGSLAVYQRGFPVAPKGYKPVPLTRDEVKQQIGATSEAQRKALRSIYVGG